MFNPVVASKNIKEEFVSYLTTSFQFADKGLRDQLISELNSNISNGPWLETNDIFKSGKSINELIGEGVLSPLFRELEAKKPTGTVYKKCLPLDRNLYLHQENAIKSIVGGENVVVSTGTGSGKTNCFLIPVINELLREQEEGTLGPGIRALFIYPMNALANDQMKNIRKILMCYPDITFGVYNGGTEEDEKDAIALYESMFANDPVPELRKRLSNELLSREKMKDNPPNILFTNYAMLEHLLFRPKDDVLFSKSDFRFVVLDEAHVYSGATGIETSILLRRLRARISSTKETQFILTSATLGSSKDSDDDIVTFANNLCGVTFKKENIIRATRVKYVGAKNVVNYSNALINELADESKVVASILKKYGLNVDDSKDENELLYDFVSSSSLYNDLRMGIDRISTIEDIQKVLKLDEETAISFISICTRAQKDGKSLIDARYHFFIRSLEGCYIALTPNRRIFLTRRRNYIENNLNYAVFEIALCDDCGKYALVGKMEGKYLLQANKLEEEIEYYYFAEDDNGDVEDEEDEDKRDYYYLCPHCGTIIDDIRKKDVACDCVEKDYIKLVKARILTTGARCGHCHSGTYKRFYIGNDGATSVLATSLYEELPEVAFVENVVKRKLFGGNGQSVVVKEERKTGRQFLAFSDSRQEAAKFACYLEKSYEEFLRRRGICQVIATHKNELISAPYSVSNFVMLLSALLNTNRCFAESNSDKTNLTVKSRKNAWIAMLNELARYSRSTSLTELGVLQFKYMGHTKELVQQIVDAYNASEEAVQNLLDLLFFEIVKTGALVPDLDTDIDDNDREYIFYSPLQKFVTKLQLPDNKKSTITNWSPRNRNGDPNRFFKTSKLYYVTKYLNISEKEAADFLNSYFDYLTIQENGNPYLLVDKNGDKNYVLPAKYIQVKIAGDPSIKWYRCKKCGRISQFHINGKCAVVGCDGEAVEVDPSELNKDNHFAKLYFSDRMSPLFIKEHTAQLSKKESADYQEQFIKKDINALSCSTTFEMGVDVGDLETVFLRDVPPLPSNYAQRAGRAGRSVNAAAFALTFAKLSSHDLSFFKEPEKMIKGTILPPLFKVDNEKIVRRHIYAIALSMYFADHPDQYDYNKADTFINDKGYVGFIDWINTKPERLKIMIKDSIPDINDLYERLGIEDFGWLDGFIGEEGVFTTLIREFENNVKDFELLIKAYKKADELDKASKCERKLNIYKSNKLIDFLARGNILPRYGFPVDTVELEQNSTADNIKKLRLSRDLSIAIAEYAPSSEVIADGKMYTSRYIKKTTVGNNKQEWHTAYIGRCSNGLCQAINYSVTPIGSDGVKCCSCGEMLHNFDFSESIEPRSGFVTERVPKDVPLTKQEKNYRSDDYYIGNTESKTIDKKKFKFNGIEVTIESTTNDSLMVKSSNNFYVCPKCGYAYAEDESIPKDKAATKLMQEGHHHIVTTTKHESLFGQYDCDCQELYKFTMHHTFNTDVAKISFDCDTSNMQVMVSTMYAILYAISDELNIERRDIKACLSLKFINNKPCYSIIIYDAVPGGAGHSRRLVTDDGKMLYAIIQAALRKMNNCSCDPSCYNCLRSYENQKIHDILDRNLAAGFLEQLIGDIEIID